MCHLLNVTKYLESLNLVFAYNASRNNLIVGRMTFQSLDEKMRKTKFRCVLAYRVIATKILEGNMNIIYKMPYTSRYKLMLIVS